LVLSPVFPLLSIKAIKKFFSVVSRKYPFVFGVSQENGEVYTNINKFTKNLVLLSKIENEIIKLKKLVCFDINCFILKKKIWDSTTWTSNCS